MRFLAVLLVTFLSFSLAECTVLAANPEKYDILKLPECQVATSSFGGKLLLSNSPEMVDQDGILYEDKVEGKIRLFIHHVNASETSKRAVVILENRSFDDAHVLVSCYGFGGPGYNWMAVGKEALSSYLAGNNSSSIRVSSQFSIPLPASNNVLLPQMGVSGIFDLEIDRPITIKVIMLPVLADEWTFSRQAPILPHDKNHLRGTFEGANRRITFSKDYDPNANCAIALTLADNRIDLFLEGIDATDGSKVINYGNYGVVYQIFPNARETGRVAYYINPRGGNYAGVIRVNYQDSEQVLVDIPDGRLYFGEDKYKDFASLGVFENNEPLCFTFSPPGSSNLPVKMVMMPQ